MKLNTRRYKRRSFWQVWLFAAIFGLSLPALLLFPESIGRQDPGTTASQAPSALVVHDNQAGDEQASLLADLLGHFEIAATIIPQADYLPGDISRFDKVFYLNRDGGTIPDPLLEDISQASGTVVWIGFGFEQFTQRYDMRTYGFTLAQTGDQDFRAIEYRERTMQKPDSRANLLTLFEGEQAQLYAEMVDEKSGSAPYIVRGKNLWQVADVPLQSPTQYSDYLVFADLLHEMVGIDHPERHQALIRIEDVHPRTSQENLRAIADYLHAETIPFSVALIPVYEDPLSGDSSELDEVPGFLATIRYMQEQGGTIVLHGYSHSYRGESAVDFEFWDAAHDRPPWAESEGWVKQRLQAAQEACARSGIEPQAWETPHYTASIFTQKIIARYFPVLYGRRGEVFFPFLIESDSNGQRVVPETMGYVRKPEDAVNEAAVPQTGELIAVRDGFASAFFHPFMKLELLKELTGQMRLDGFTFVTLDSLADGSLPRAVEMSAQDTIQSWVSGMQHELDVKGAPSLGWSALIGGAMLFYYALVFGLGRRVRSPKPQLDPKLQFFFVIPALNEEQVIGATLDHLLALPADNVHVLVMNDNSDDDTAAIVKRYASDRCMLINRPAAIARKGKGQVLNHAYRYLRKAELTKVHGCDNIILAVLDADGQVNKNIIHCVSPYFADPATGAVQASVRIFNAHANILTRWQQFEFLTFNRVFQRGREKIGSVGLGGNGQFVRLSALISLGEQPWSDCLTEDLDIGIRLLLGKWRNHFAGETYVAQQAVTNLRTLIRQRTRWFQGHVTCWLHIPGILSGKLRLITCIDTVYYLLAIILIYLFFPSSLLFAGGASLALATGAIGLGDLTYDGFWPYLLLFYALSFGPLPIMAFIYWKEDGSVSLPGAMLWAHVFTIIYYIWFAAGCMAIVRLARVQNNWAKTPRCDTSETGDKQT